MDKRTLQVIVMTLLVAVVAYVGVRLLKPTKDSASSHQLLQTSPLRS